MHPCVSLAEATSSDFQLYYVMRYNLFDSLEENRENTQREEQREEVRQKEREREGQRGRKGEKGPYMEKMCRMPPAKQLVTMQLHSIYSICKHATCIALHMHILWNDQHSNTSTVSQAAKRVNKNKKKVNIK